jgi:hypothetical protein
LDNFYARTNGFVSEMVRACQGSTGAQQKISLLIGQIMHDDAARPLGQSLMQIVVGERDRALLTRNLDGEPLWLINRILDELAASPPQSF